MAKEPLAEPQAYAKIVEGEIALKSGNPGEAIKILTGGQRAARYLARPLRPRQGLSRGRSLSQADGEFERCIKRRGEALQTVLNDAPTYGSLPPVYYYRGRAREGQGADAAVS